MQWSIHYLNNEGGTANDGGPTVDFQPWHHYLATYSGGTSLVYVDGVLVDSKHGVTANPGDDAYETWIGNSTPVQQEFRGHMYSVRIWRSVVDASAIGMLSAAPDSEWAEGDLVGAWHPGAQVDGIVRDESGRGNDCSVEGSVPTVESCPPGHGG